jgi:hypothetical protein
MTRSPSRALMLIALDERGMGTYAVSWPWGGGPAELWDLRGSDPPSYVRDLATTSSAEPTVLGLAELAGARYMLYSDRETDGVWSFYLEDVDRGGSRLVSRSRTTISGAVERLGDDLVIALRATPPRETAERVFIARATPDGHEPTEGAISLSEPDRTAHSERMTRTPRGIAIAWSEATGDTDGLSARLAILDCCGPR